jgi:hypothetical protein
MRPSGDTSVISVITRPAPPMARLPRCTRCQSSMVPSSAEYWHIGETTTRFSSTSSRSLSGVNMGGGAEVRAGASFAARGRRSASTLATSFGSRSRRLLVGDAQAAREQAEGELQRLERSM